MTAATKIALISLVCCFVCAPTMFGDNVITQTCTIAQTAPPYTDSCTFNDFNTLLGPLNWVSLYLTDVGGNAQPQQTNIGGTDLTFSESYTTVIMTMTGPDGTVSTVSQSTPGAPPGDPSLGCSGTVLAHSTNTTCPTTDFSGLSGNLATAATLSDYEAVGSGFTLSVSAVSRQNSFGSGGPGSGGTLFFGGDGMIGGELILTYDYNPEPRTMALCGGALLLLVGLLRKSHVRTLAR